MNYFTKLIERLGKGPLTKTDTKAPEDSPTNPVEPADGPAEQSRL